MRPPPLRHSVQASGSSFGGEPMPRPSEEKSTNSHPWQAAGLSTGFPVPIGYAEEGKSSRQTAASVSIQPRGNYDFFGRSLIQRRSSIQRKENGDNKYDAEMDESESSGPSSLSPSTGPVRPSFRATPFLAEFQRQQLLQQGSTTTRILVIDEGGEFRATLAVSLLRHMLSRTRTRLDVAVDFASLGLPSLRESRGQELKALAKDMGLELPPSNEVWRTFDDVADPVRYDLILVMDRFDLQEVLRDVAVLDTINPGGHYAGRVRLLGPFAMSAKRAVPADVPDDVVDPLYEAQLGPQAEQAAMKGAAKDLAFACRGLVSYLLALQSRCQGSDGDGVGCATLQEALSQSLRCPLLLGELPARSSREAPKGPEMQRTPGDKVFSVRSIGGRRKVVRRSERARGFWKDRNNVEKELKSWMKTRRTDRLPSQKELRQSGCSSLASAIDVHGGLAVFSGLLGVRLSARRSNGYWQDFEVLSRALTPYLRSVNVGNATRGGKDCAAVFLPTQRQLRDAGRADLLRAIRCHGGSAAVARRMGIGVRRGGGWTEQELAQQLIVVAGNATPDRRQLVLRGHAELVSAVDRLGGFPYFRHHIIQSPPSSSSSSSLLLSLPVAPCLGGQEPSPSEEKDFRSLPMIDRAVVKVQRWITQQAQQQQSVNDSSSSGRGGNGSGVCFEVGGKGALCHKKTLVVTTKTELMATGAGDVWVTIQRSGGGRRVAEYMGWEWVETRGRPRKSKNDGSTQHAEQGRGGTGGGPGGAAPNPKEEIDILEAEEEVVFV